MKEREFKAWLAKAQHGDVVVYHHGHIAHDTKKNLDLARVAERAWQGASKGFLQIVQRKIGPGMFDYLAIAGEGAHRTADLHLSTEAIESRAPEAKRAKAA